MIINGTVCTMTLLKRKTKLISTVGIKIRENPQVTAGGAAMYSV